MACDHKSGVMSVSSMEKKEKPPPTLWFAFLVCLFYGATSGSLSLLIKNLLSGYRFECYFFILAAQMGLQLFLCIFTRDVLNNPFGVPAYDRAVHMKSLKMGVVNVLNVAAGFVALKMVNVPMFLCIRRLVAPTILVYELLFLGKWASVGVNGAVGTIFLGTVVAGWDTLSSDFVGYAATVVNNLFSAAVRKGGGRARETGPLRAPLPAPPRQARLLTPVYPRARRRRHLPPPACRAACSPSSFPRSAPWTRSGRFTTTR